MSDGRSSLVARCCNEAVGAHDTGGEADALFMHYITVFSQARRLKRNHYYFFTSHLTMSFLPEDILSFDVGWEQFFWHATEALYPERPATDSNEIASSMASNHSSVREYDAPQHEYRLKLNFF